ncbi:hypothetical protein Vretifemale_1621 [Volvox reticuliferus]|uniref:Uncharacterized protein n=1 Tax=Volvox reticuliferus TaxID=1737510 RepID=A0A8J4BY50_9CHLO|nr:hypothetical protein Vretifemale_1621 [Volvox reticuliferus]
MRRGSGCPPHPNRSADSGSATAGQMMRSRQRGQQGKRQHTGRAGDVRKLPGLRKQDRPSGHAPLAVSNLKRSAALACTSPSPAASGSSSGSVTNLLIGIILSLDT